MMKHLLLAMLIVCAAMVVSYGPERAYAQEPVPGLSDLVGAKAGQAENTVKERGYTWVKTDKQAAGIYSYWTEKGTGKCVTIRTADGRYQSIVYSPKFDCENNAPSKSAAQTKKPQAGDTVPALSDLVGAKAGQAEDTVKQRGYKWVKTDKQAAGSYSYWTEKGTGECVTIRTADGRYQSIVYTGGKFDCESGAQPKEAAVVNPSWTNACETAIKDKILRQHGHAEKVEFRSDSETHTQKPGAKYVLDGKGKVLKESGNWKKFTFHCVYDTDENYVVKAQYEIQN